MGKKEENKEELEVFLQIVSDETLDFDKKKDKLEALKIPFKVMDGSLTFDSDRTENEEVSHFTILGCMSDIVEDTTEYVNKGDNKVKQFNKAVFKTRAKEIAYVGKMCGTSPMQSVILSNCIEHSSNRHFDQEDLASYMGLTNIKLMSNGEDLEYLHGQKLILTQKDGSINIPRHVVPELGKNRPYKKPDYFGLGTVELLKEFKAIIKQKTDERMDESDMMDEIDQLMEANPECSFVKTARDYKILENPAVHYYERLIFYNLVYRYLYEDDDCVGWHNFEDIMDDEDDIDRYRSQYKRGELELQKLGVMEAAYEDGFADADYFKIKDEIKEQLFEEVGGLRKKSRRGGKLKIMPTSEIVSKELFYNPTEAQQISRLSSLLNETTYKDICNRLKDSGLRTGFSCIFYGSPGTGKTETAYQLAKRTGRAIVPVNVSEIKSCWVGESEKLIKGVFDKYRALVEDCDVAPILLFNEADAIFGIRREAATDAVDKMENSIQNIILQEMEKLDGILIATTNLTQNLDKAFERRFLYKIRFDKPSIEAKGKIWKSLLPSLSEEQANELASGYDFSGGQIENISRKKVIQSIIDGTEPDFDVIKSYCGEELIENKERSSKRIGY